MEQGKQYEILLSESFAEAMNTFTPKEQDKMADIIVSLMVQVEKHLNVFKQPPVELVKDFYGLMDKAASKHVQTAPTPITCKKGCAACCHIEVWITEWEAMAIWDYCLTHNIRVDIEKLKGQAPLNQHTLPLSEHAGCVFLGSDNSCAIYKARPLNCRKHFVTTPAELCNPKRELVKDVCRSIGTEMEILFSTFYSSSPNKGNMAAMLLATMPEQYKQKL